LSDNNVVLAIFKDEPSADAAVAQLKQWDKSDDRVKLGAMGVLALDDDGNVKTHKMGSRSVVKGGGIGLVLALITPVGVPAAVVGGSLLGALHRKGLGLTDKDKDRISAKLFDGKAAVGVLAKDEQAKLISEKLTELGGEPEVHAVSDEALKQAANEVPGA
jgi:uncharacterized membrane protein